MGYSNVCGLAELYSSACIGDGDPGIGIRYPKPPSYRPWPGSHIGGQVMAHREIAIGRITEIRTVAYVGRQSGGIGILSPEAYT